MIFSRTVGIDYSGAETPRTRLSGLQVCCELGAGPARVGPPQRGNIKNWNRQEIAKWLVATLKEDTPTLVGIDHAFSFPEEYFVKYGLPRNNWPAFLDDFQKNWPTDTCDATVANIRTNSGMDRFRTGAATWLRVTERYTPAPAKSVFHFDIPGQVATSTHAGLPWLRYIRRNLKGRVHFWPFDGWTIPPGKSAVAEVYPALWKSCFRRRDRRSSPHEHDAYSIAAWLWMADQAGILPDFLTPPSDLTDSEFKAAQEEGWILGV